MKTPTTEAIQAESVQILLQISVKAPGSLCPSRCECTGKSSCKPLGKRSVGRDLVQTHTRQGLCTKISRANPPHHPVQSPCVKTSGTTLVPAHVPVSPAMTPPVYPHRRKLAPSYGWGVMVSHRSGETEDTFIADLVVGHCTGQVSPSIPCHPPCSPMTPSIVPHPPRSRRGLPVAPSA